MTTRDDAWDTILTTLLNRGKFKISELPFGESESHTIRRVCRTMEEKDWLRRESPQSAVWRLGPKAETVLAVTDETVDASRK